MKKIILTGGGTGGHVYPALALVDNLKSQFDIFYIGSNGMEKEIVKNLPYYEISAVKLVRKLTPKNFLIPFKLLKAKRQAKKILKEIKPDIIFSKGGFVAVPVVMAANSLNIPVVSHESDLTLGLANKIILHYSKAMCTNFYDTSKVNKKCIFTGAPIRQSIFHGNMSKAFNICKFKCKKPVLLVLGGSLGAKNLNNLIVDNIGQLTKTFNIVHITGKNNASDLINDSYYQIEYTNNIEDFYSIADIVISRAGAGVIHELLALKKVNLLIPLSKACSRGDQIDNAKKFTSLGYSEMIEEEDLKNYDITQKLETMLKNKEKYIESMKTYSISDPNQKIIDVIVSCLKH